MRSLFMRFLRVGLRTAHPCLLLFMLVGLLFPALTLSVTPMVSAGSSRVAEGNRLRYFWLFSLTTSKPPRLRVGLKDVSREEFSTALNTQLGKQRVSIMLDGSIIAYFKAKAGERGYQTLINQALHQAMTAEQIESTLRRVIREELHPA